MKGFKLEEYLGEYEFSDVEMICASDLDGWPMQDILDMADAECRALWKNLSLGYTEVRGAPLLRRDILSTYSTSFDVAQNIIVTSGAEEALYASMQALLSKDDHVIVMSPCYQSHVEIPKAMGCQVSEWVLKADEFWQPNVERLRQLIRPETKLIVINMPHNPTGMICSKQVLDEIVEIAKGANAYLLNDEVYRDMEHDTADQLPHIADVYEKGISVNVMTKSYGLAGLRIGWVVSPDSELIEKIESYKHYLSICSSAPSEILSMIALRNRHKIFQHNKAYMLKNFVQFQKFMKKYQAQFEWVEPKGGCIGFVKIKHAELNSQSFCDNVREKANLLLLPGAVYDVQEPYFRIGFGRKNFLKLLKRFEAYLDDVF